MCGIAGIAGELPVDAEERLSRSLALLEHRGPDGEGRFRARSVVLGMQRLAVIDVANGDQPIFNEDRSIAVVCNGEIYNYKEEMARLAGRGHRFQSAADVNVIPHGYEDDGVAAVDHWRGMFAAALWDERTERLTLWRDRVGKKPLFYHRQQDCLMFASELPALVALIGRAPGMDPGAIREYLRFGYVPHPGTVFQGVRALPPGSVLQYRPGETERVARYWRRGEARPTSFGTRAEAVDAIDRGLVEATRLRLRADVPIGLFLSGGIDSGLVASAAVRAGAERLTAYTVSVGDPALDEGPEAELTARHLGLSIERIELTLAPADLVSKIALIYGQPFGDSSAVPSYAVARAARRDRTVVLNGDGGDEIFAGYARYVLGRWSRPDGPGGAATPVWTALRRGLAGAGRRSTLGLVRRAARGYLAPPGDRFRLWTGDLFDDAAMAACFPGLSGAQAGWLGDDFPPAYDGFRAMLHADYEWLLPDDLLVKADMATMAHGLEARSPFLDTELAELAWALPDRWLLSGLGTKPLLRDLARRYLPNRISRAPKRGFEVPVARWLAADLRDMVRDILLAPNARIAQWCDRDAVASLVSGQLKTDGNQPQMLWVVLMLELFLRGQRDVV